MLQIVAIITGSIGILWFGSAASVARAQASMQEAMVFELTGNGGNCGVCYWVRAEGIITERTPSDFSSFINAEQSLVLENTVVLLNSSGGNLNAARELGRAFRDHHVYTQIGTAARDKDGNIVVQSGTCASACFFAFIGGERRSLITDAGLDVVNDSRLGVHRFSAVTQDQSMDAAQRMAGSQAAYLSEMAVDSKILALAAAVPATGMRYLTAGEAATLSHHHRAPSTTALDNRAKWRWYRFQLERPRSE